MTTLANLSDEFNFDAMMLYFRTSFLQQYIHLRNKTHLYFITHRKKIQLTYNILCTTKVSRDTLAYYLS